LLHHQVRPAETRESISTTTLSPSAIFRGNLILGASRRQLISVLSGTVLILAAVAKAIEVLSGPPDSTHCGVSSGRRLDILGRVLGQKLHEILGQPVVIDNRAGGSGTIGTAAAAEA
jgi:hypothetical protein